MNASLHNLIEDAETRLGARDRDKLAALIESFLATYGGTEGFTAEELAHLRRLEAEPFDPADPADVADFFAGRG